MAIETLISQITLTDTPGLCARNLEHIARAALSGKRRAAAAVVEGAADLLLCEAAVLLRPTRSPGVVAATWHADVGGAARHELWELGPHTPQVFERTCHSADGWREPWSGLRMKLQGLEVRSWAAMPLRNERSAGPLGLLVVGARNASSRPCGRLHHLPDLALSATAALAAAPGREEGSSCVLSPEHERLQTIGNLAFGVSHTLGNIFGGIIGNLQFLQEEMPSAAARDLIGRIEDSTADGVELMRALQAYTALPAEAAMQACDLSEVAHEVASLARGLTEHWPSHQRVQIETDLAAAAPTWGDARQLRESLMNVVFNAIQAVGREGRIVIRTASDGRLSEVRVIDDGPGMSDETRPRATEPFFTTYPALHDGLGLTVARGVAVAHRGSLTLHRAPVHGTEVALRLPQDPPADRRCEMPIGAALPGAAGHRKEHRR